MSQTNSLNETAKSASPSRRQRRRLRLSVATAVYAILALATAAAAVLAVSSHDTLETALSTEGAVGAEAAIVSQRYSLLKESHAEQFSVFKADEQAALADGYDLTDAVGVYSRAGTLDALGAETYCTQFEGCFLFALRTNSFTECPAGVTAEVLTSTGERLSGTNPTPFSRNGTLQMEINWPPANATAELSTVTCE